MLKVLFIAYAIIQTGLYLLMAKKISDMDEKIQEIIDMDTAAYMNDEDGFYDDVEEVKD